MLLFAYVLKWGKALEFKVTSTAEVSTKEGACLLAVNYVSSSFKLRFLPPALREFKNSGSPPADEGDMGLSGAEEHLVHFK